MKIIITGGHHNSALVVAKKLVESGHSVEWIGHRYAAAGDTHDSAEYIEVKAAGIPFHNLVAGKSSYAPINLFRVPAGFVRARRLIASLHADAVLSFGGYLGLAVSAVAHFLHIPIFIHEQTCIAGKANKICSVIAKRVYLTWESSRHYYPANKSLVIGLPLRPSFRTATARKLFTRDKPAILIMGGKQGSHAINTVIFQHLVELLEHFNIIHQTGNSSATGDYAKAIALQESLPPNLAQCYLPRGYIGEEEVAVMMKSVDLYIGRSGAHTTYELGVLGKKSLLIPFLATHGQEQLKNARVLENAGIGVIVPQSELSYPVLDKKITEALKSGVPAALNLPTDAADRLILDLVHTLSL